MARIEQTAVSEYVRELMDQARLLEGKYGFKIEMTTREFRADSADVVLRVTSDDDVKADPLDTAHGRQFTRMAELVGLSPDDLGREFKYRDKTYTLIGYDVARARPFIVLDAFGVIREGNEKIIPSVKAARLAS